MKWAKIPTEFLFKLSDREIVAVAKYVMLYGVLETVPTRSECLRVMSEKQLETIQKHFETISKIISADINVAQYNRDRIKQKRAENRAIQQKSTTNSPTDSTTENPTDSPKYRIDKNREEKSNTLANARVLPRAPVRATNPQTSPPTLDDVLTYAKQQHQLAGGGGFHCLRATAEEFWAKYSANGWRECNDARTPIIDWHAKLRQWAIKQKQFEPKTDDDIPAGPRIAKGDC